MGFQELKTDKGKRNALVRAFIAALTTLLPLIVQKEKVQELLSKEFLLLLENWVWWLSAFGLLIVFLFGYSLSLFNRIRYQAESKAIWILSVVATVSCLLFGEHISFLVGVVALAVTTGAYFRLLLPEAVRHREPLDFLHRRYLAKRIVEYLLNNKDSEGVRRIGIIGSWGSGKTRVLELVRDELLSKDSESKFKLVAINAWRANTSADVWRIFSDGFDIALGLKQADSGANAGQSFLRKIAKHMPSLVPGVSQSVVDVLTATIDNEEERLARLESAFEYLRAKGIRIVFLVDDIERASPEIVRAIFPILDRLSEFSSCNFILAIDPERIAQAFGSSSSAKEEIEGYLTKVIDLQIELDTPTPRDVRLMAESMFDSSVFPKLSQSLDELSPYLSKNPRLLTRFINLCKSKEFMWLDRHGNSEVSYAPFFLVRLIEAEFSGISKVLEHRSEMVRGAAMGGVFDVKKEKSERKQYQALLATLKKDLNLNEQRATRLDELLGALMSVSSSHLLGIVDDGYDFDWILNDHSKLLQLSRHECEKARVVFLENAGIKSIGEILATACPQKDFEALDVCASQLLKATVDNISERLRLCYSDARIEHSLHIMPCVEGCDALLKHFAWSKGSVSKVDLHAYGTDFFGVLMNFFGRSHAPLMFEETFQPVREKMAQLHEMVAASLPIAFVVSVPTETLLKDDNFSAPIDLRVTEHLKRIISIFEEKKYLAVVKAFSEENGVKEFHRYWPEKESYGFFNRAPEEWLGGGPKAVENLDKLIREAESDAVIRKNFQYLVYWYFFSPFLIKSIGAAQQQFEIAEQLRANKWYILGIWKAATIYPTETMHYDLFEMRKRIVSRLRESSVMSQKEGQISNGESVGPDLFESAFPLE